MTYSLFTCEAQSAVILVSDSPLYALGPVIVADDTAEAYEAMAAFCDALGAPPDEVPTIALMTEWQGFLTVVSGRVIAPLDAVSETAGDPAAAVGSTEAAEDVLAAAEAAGEAPGLAEDVIADEVQAQEPAPGGSEDYSGPPTSASPTGPSSASARSDAAASGSGPDAAPEAAGLASGPEAPPPIGGEPDDDQEPDEDDGPDLAGRIAEARHTPAKDGYKICWACDGEGTVDVGGQTMDCAACRGKGRIAEGTPTHS